METCPRGSVMSLRSSFTAGRRRDAGFVDHDAGLHVARSGSADGVHPLPRRPRAIVTPATRLEVHQVQIHELTVAVSAVGDPAIAVEPLIRLRAVERAVEPRSWEEMASCTARTRYIPRRLRARPEPCYGIVEAPSELLVRLVDDGLQVGIRDAVLVDTDELGLQQMSLPLVDLPVHRPVPTRVPEEREMTRYAIRMRREHVIAGEDIIGVEAPNVPEQEVGVAPTVEVVAREFLLVQCAEHRPEVTELVSVRADRRGARATTGPVGHSPRMTSVGCGCSARRTPLRHSP